VYRLIKNCSKIIPESVRIGVNIRTPETIKKRFYRNAVSKSVKLPVLTSKNYRH